MQDNTQHVLDTLIKLAESFIETDKKYPTARAEGSTFSLNLIANHAKFLKDLYCPKVAS